MMKDKMRHHVWVDGKVKCRQGWEKNPKRMMGRNESRKQRSKEKERREKQIIKA